MENFRQSHKHSGFKRFFLNCARKAMILALLLSGACAHHRDVRPGSDGIHSVRITSEDKEAGSREAIEQANDFCKKYEKMAVFLNEESKYEGSMSESDYKTAKTTAKVAQAVGGAGYVFGGKNERSAGGILGLGGGIASEALGKGYSVNMKFKCQ
ncbi:MAG TPA: hypothetical protein VIG33_10125 [Pseudobdellovibrionaceae bacterium]|jgi:hypothetical protein